MLKHCSKCYRNIGGVLYVQWADDVFEEYVDIKEHKKENPEYKFIKRNDRIYKSVEKIVDLNKNN